MQRLKPLNDFIFKKLFGEKDDEVILLSFLNSIISKTYTEPLTEIIIIENKELTKEMLEDKTGRIDVRAKTQNGEQINIEVQLTDQYNMEKRTLFYWGKLFLEGIKQGEDYTNLKKVITINLLDFNYLETKDYHSSFHLWEDVEKDYLLSDIVEIHFIELPKFRKSKLENIKEGNKELNRWLSFLQQDISEERLEEIIEMDPAIKMAEEKLEKLSHDPDTIALYRAREDSAHERANLIITGIRKGIEEGIQQGIQQGIHQRNIEVAVNLLDILDDKTISQKTGLSIEEVKKLRMDNGL